MGTGRESVTRLTGTETLPRHLRVAAVENLPLMRASVTERRRVRDEGLRVVNRFRRGGNAGGLSPRFDLSSKEGRAKFVPAAAVRRTVQTLFGITGLKGCVGGPASWV